MLATQIGYAGRAGDYYPAAACTVPALSSVAAIRGAGIETHEPQEVKKIHLHIKNLTRTGAAIVQNNLVSCGGYTSRYALAVSFYAFSNGEIHLAITTTQRNGSYGKYYSIRCSPSYAGGFYEDNSTQYSWLQKIPGELELTYENGRVRIWVDRELRIDRDDVLSGTFISAWRSETVSVYYNPGWSYDLVDFTYETAKGSCRFVPMKTADGQNAVYEVYSQQVAEI